MDNEDIEQIVCAIFMVIVIVAILAIGYVWFII
jgi:hypothetical protein